jgi:thioredoxin
MRVKVLTFYAGAGGMITVTDANFEADVRRAALPVLLDFWAPWCRPCESLARELETLAPRVEGKLRIATANTAECRSLPARLGVTALPTLVLFMAGHEVKRVPGVPTAAALRELFSCAGLSPLLRRGPDEDARAVE